MEEKNRYVNGGRFSSRAPWIHGGWIGKHYELILVAEGEMWMREDGIDYPLSEGMILVLEPNKFREGYKVSEKKVSFYWIHFDVPDPDLSMLNKTMKLSDPQSVEMLCRQMIYYEVKKFDRSVRNALLHVMLSELARQSADISKVDPLAARVHEWMRINFDRIGSATEVAEHFGYNTDYMSRLYKKNYGVSIKKAIDENKMKRIKHYLLETDRTLREISEAVGMSDYKIFLKYFRYHEGVTPSEYRKLYRIIHTNNV